MLILSIVADIDLNQTASPLEVLWTSTSFFGALCYAVLFGLALADLRIVRRNSYFRDDRLVALEQAVVMAFMMVVELIFLGIGIVAMLTPPEPQPGGIASPSYSLETLALTIGFIFAQALMAGVAGLKIYVRRRLSATYAYRRKEIAAVADRARPPGEVLSEDSS